MRIVPIDENGRIVVGSQTLPEERSVCIARHPLKTGIYAILPSSTGVRTPEYLEHLKALGVSHLTVRTQRSSKDNSYRINISRLLSARAGSESQKAGVVEVGGVHFLLLGPSEEALKRKLRLLTKSPSPKREKGPQIVRPRLPDDPAKVERALRRYATGTRRHERDMMFAKHRVVKGRKK